MLALDGVDTPHRTGCPGLFLCYTGALLLGVVAPGGLHGVD